MKLSEIIVPEDWKLTPPCDEKMEATREIFEMTGGIGNKTLVVDKNDVLTDGYVGLLVLQENGVDEWFVEPDESYLYEPTMYVWGEYENGREGVWRIARRTKRKNLIRPGRMMLVPSKSGETEVRVTFMEVLNRPPVDRDVYAVRSGVRRTENV